MRKVLTHAAVLLVLSICPFLVQARDLVFCGDDDNDFLKLLKSQSIPCSIVSDPHEAVRSARPGSGVFISAAGYPDLRTEIGPDDYRLAKSRNLRLFVEYPSSIPGQNPVGETYHGKFERAVITSDIFGEDLPQMSVLTVNDCSIIRTEVADPLVVYAKVAGFDKAEYGLTDTDVYPLLFLCNRNVMVSATRLSEFSTSRFGPDRSWKAFWETVVSWLCRENVSLEGWKSDPSPMYSKDEPLPADARITAVRKGADWLFKAKLFIHPSWKKQALEYQGDGTNPFGPPVPQTALCGNGSLGVLEGHASNIYLDGRQQYRYWRRCDVQGEVSFLLSCAYALTDEPVYKEYAENLMDYIFYDSVYRQGAHDDRESPVYGLLGWGDGQNWVFYGDDNARAVLGAMGASSLMGNERWNRQIVENILANFRTASKQGFHGERLHEPDIVSNGWEYYNDRDLVFVNMNFEAYCWALYLWLYDKTGYEPLLRKAESAIRITMQSYPDGWKPIQGFQMERARILLPLAWLIRVEDTPEHREWLDVIMTDLLKCQDECGAVVETYVNGTGGANGRTQSNASYGTTEAPLNFSNEDKVSDLLYTCNFLVFGLNEAVKATGDGKYDDALARLADFILRAQVRSDNHPDIDGAWFRAFDFGIWDYWAENADAGWGAWCTLSGWIQSWLVGSEAMIEKNTSLWDITRNMDVRKHFEESMWMLDRTR